MPAARSVVDGSGLWLCPGFIDMHTHSGLISFDDPFLTPKLAQGFTTEVINPDGLAPAPVARERWPERYQSMSLPAALRALHRTARIYKDDVTLVDPKTGREYATLAPT